MSRRGAFLDRDGTLNVRPPEHAYVGSVADFTWLPGAADGAARLAAAGYVLAVVSNQRGLSRGLVDTAVLHALERVIQRELADRGSSVRAFRYCPHDEQALCDCRKPRPGMILQVAHELDLDVRRSWMIGDSESDVVAAHAAGCRAALVGAVPERWEPDLVAPSLDAASKLIVRDELSRRSRPRQRRTPRRGSDMWTSDHRRC